MPSDFPDYEDAPQPFLEEAECVVYEYVHLASVLMREAFRFSGRHHSVLLVRQERGRSNAGKAQVGLLLTLLDLGTYGRHRTFNHLQRMKKIIGRKGTPLISSHSSIDDRRRPGANRSKERHRVVVVGGGFGGLEVVAGLAGSPVTITLIDQRNYHLFQPLLYQVATASLATSEIAWPIRYLVRGRREVTTVLATVVGVDANAHHVLIDGGRTVPYDTLVLATGARHAYFGHDEWEAFAPGLKTLEDATTVRRRLLLAFERAESETDSQRRAALLTFVIIGAGPTGVELAGTIAELARETLRPDFRNIDTATARVILIEAGPRVLTGFADDLAAYAQRSLERLGVEVELGQPVSECSSDGVVFGGRHLAARTMIWAAGVRASPAAEWLGAPADRAGRLVVLPDLTVPGRPEIFAIGDTVTTAGPDGKPVPGIAPAAKQQGRYVARVLNERVRGETPPRPFCYRHAGSLATIGKRLAVIDFGAFKLRGALAWWIWGFAHIYFLIGLRNRLSVVLNWLWIHTRDQRSARLITQGDNLPAESRRSEDKTIAAKK